MVKSLNQRIMARKLRDNLKITHWRFNKGKKNERYSRTREKNYHRTIRC